MAGTEEIVPPQEGEEVVVFIYLEKFAFLLIPFQALQMISVIQFT